MIAGTAKDKAPYFVQGTTLESSRTENPADSAALANRWCPQMGLSVTPRGFVNTQGNERARIPKRGRFLQSSSSLSARGLHRLVSCNASRRNPQEFLYIESHLGETQFPGRNQTKFLIVGTFHQKWN